MPVSTTAEKYIYPPRPQTSLPRTELDFFKDLGYIAQLKYNGSRCLIKHLPDGTIQLWNRHAERFRTYHAPEWLLDELKQSLLDLGFAPDQYHLLDGELLDQKHSEIKDTIVIWDVLVRDGMHLVSTSYRHRYNSLYNAISTLENWMYKDFIFGRKLSDHVFFAMNYTDYDAAWSIVDLVNKPFPDRPLIEGVVLKDLDGVLERGYSEKNNHSWLVRSRVQTGRHNF